MGREFETVVLGGFGEILILAELGVGLRCNPESGPDASGKSLFGRGSVFKLSKGAVTNRLVSAKNER